MFLALLASPAFACLFAVGAPHEVVANPDDTTAPSTPGALSAEVTRGVGPTCSFGVCQSTSCDDIGTIYLSFPGSEDDVSAPTAIGYRLRVVEGAPPDDLTVDETRDPDSVDGDAHLALIWIDEATDDQEPFSFVIGVTAVDEAGNESAEVTLEISDEGSEATGCSTAGGGAGVLGLVLAGVAAGRRRLTPQ